MNYYWIGGAVLWSLCFFGLCYLYWVDYQYYTDEGRRRDTDDEI